MAKKRFAKVRLGTFIEIVFLMCFIALLCPGDQLTGVASHRRLDNSSARTKLPQTFLWAWERPEDLRFLKTENIGVAFLAETIEIRPQRLKKSSVGVTLNPRRQPLRVRENVPLMAVVRIETSHDLWHQPHKASAGAASPPARLYMSTQRDAVVNMITGAAKLPHVQALQIDFDASESEHAFYSAVLEDVRQRLPPEMPLSITALASWCIGDPWLNALPPGTIDEAVPMLFRMGPDAARVDAYVKSGDQFVPLACRGSLGLSTDESFSKDLLDGTIRLSSGREAMKRLYIFSNRAWTEAEVRAITKGVER
ncbi:MAG TPA: DUF3142 domain-containing protein [Candidatus Methylomirabilis sp.]|nr:DUF3142 domain-containing protein [Candidatus Methylomirabilis sp.]